MFILKPLYSLCMIDILQVAKVHHGTKIHHIGDIKGISRDKVICLCCLAYVFISAASLAGLVV